MNRRKLASRNHKFIKKNTFAKQNVNKFLYKMKIQLVEEEKVAVILENKLEELTTDLTNSQSQKTKKIKVIKLQKVKNEIKVKTMRQLIDEEEKKLNEIDNEENKLDLIDILEDSDNDSTKD